MKCKIFQQKNRVARLVFIIFFLITGSVELQAMRGFEGVRQPVNLSHLQNSFVKPEYQQHQVRYTGPQIEQVQPSSKIKVDLAQDNRPGVMRDYLTPVEPGVFARTTLPQLKLGFIGSSQAPVQKAAELSSVKVEKSLESVTGSKEQGQFKNNIDMGQILAAPKPQVVSDIVAEQSVVKKVALENIDTPVLSRLDNFKKALADAQIANAREALGGPKSDVYKALKNQYYPDGLPEGTSLNSLFATSGAQGASGLSLLQGLGEVGLKKVVVESNSQAGSKAANPLLEALQAKQKNMGLGRDIQIQDQAIQQAKARIQQEVQAQFQQDLPQLEQSFKTEYSEYVDKPNFNETMQAHMKAELVNRTQAAYQNRSVEIDKAGQDAVTQSKLRQQSQANKNGRVTPEQKAQNAFVMSQAGNDAMQTMKKQIGKEVELDFKNNAQAQWQKEYKFKNPGFSDKGMQQAQDAYVAHLKNEAYKTPENKQRIQVARDQAVENLRNQPISVAAQKTFVELLNEGKQKLNNNLFENQAFAGSPNLSRSQSPVGVEFFTSAG